MLRLAEKLAINIVTQHHRIVRPKPRQCWRMRCPHPPAMHQEGPWSSQRFQVGSISQQACQSLQALHHRDKGHGSATGRDECTKTSTHQLLCNSLEQRLRDDGAATQRKHEHQIRDLKHGHRFVFYLTKKNSQLSQQKNNTGTRVLNLRYVWRRHWLLETGTQHHRIVRPKPRQCWRKIRMNNIKVSGMTRKYSKDEPKYDRPHAVI